MGMLAKVTAFDKIEGTPTLAKCGNQSLQHTKPCGCVLTEHFFCGRPNMKEDHPAYAEVQAQRHYWVEFCKQHSKLDEEDSKEEGK